ncbi:MAG TPA: molybdopterin dinucleotide binding domain-containing protein, partial [Micromonosporaceae bacterium]
RLMPGSPHLRSEVDIITSLGHALFGDDIGWQQMGADYGIIRKHIEHIVPGFHSYEERAAQPGGFMLPRGPHDSRTFNTATGKARFTVNPPTTVEVPDGHLLLQTVRSHDQFNTTVYGLDDRYRGIKGGRRVIFVNADDLRDRGLRDGDMVDVVSIWSDGERRAKAFRAVAYPTPRGCAAAYFPEANVLVPLDSTAEVSNTPASKSTVIRLEATEAKTVVTRQRTEEPAELAEPQKTSSGVAPSATRTAPSAAVASPRSPNASTTDVTGSDHGTDTSTDGPSSPSNQSR